MVTPRHPNDTVTIAPGVLLTVARMATLDVRGVVRMGNTPGGVDRDLHQLFLEERNAQSFLQCWAK